MSDIIKQGISSSTMRHFNFVQDFKLDRYTDITSPLVLFGCYNKEDIEIVKNHRGILVIRWCGVDAKRVTKETSEFFKNENIYNITPIKSIAQKLQEFDINCKVIRISKKVIPMPQILGEGVYSYASKSNILNYGLDVFQKLDIPFLKVLAYLSYTKEEWSIISKIFFDRVFCGCALSPYAGGSGSIIEMAIRGIPCITNVMDFPNTVPWVDIPDIQKKILKFSERIGENTEELAVRSCDYINSITHENFDLDIIK